MNWKGGPGEVVCIGCGTKFKVPPSWVSERRYCSKDCYTKSMRKHKARHCLCCGKEFLPNKETSLYCSRSCSDKHKVKENHSCWKGGPVGVTCANCGEVFYSKPSDNRRFCSQKCDHEFKVAENAPNWKGGTSLKPYPRTFNSGFKKAIRERDNYTCAICKQYGNIVHHINYVKNDTFPENCITLCSVCHTKTNFNRSYWIEYFSNR